MNKITLQKSEHGRINFYFEDRVYLGYAYNEIDGFYVFQFENRGGVWSAYQLRWIAERLDELNKEWNEKINQELS